MFSSYAAAFTCAAPSFSPSRRFPSTVLYCIVDIAFLVLRERPSELRSVSLPNRPHVEDRSTLIEITPTVGTMTCGIEGHSSVEKGQTISSGKPRQTL